MLEWQLCRLGVRDFDGSVVIPHDIGAWRRDRREEDGADFADHGPASEILNVRGGRID